MDITLHAPITDAKTMLTFSTLHRLHYKKYLISGLLFRTTFLNFMTFHYYNICIAHKFKQAQPQLPSPNSGLFTAWKKIKTWISQLLGLLRTCGKPTMTIMMMTIMLTVTYSAHLHHEFVHVLVRHGLTASYVEVVLAQPLAVLRYVLGKQQLRRRRVLYTQTHIVRQA